MNNKILWWLEVAKESVEANTKKKWPDCELNWSTLGWTEGKKYIKVISMRMNAVTGSAYCFIDLDGNIYMAASWAKPAKGVRGTVLTVDPRSLDGSTGWLYR